MSTKGKVDPKLLQVGGSFKKASKPEIVVGSRNREDFPGLVEALNELSGDESIAWSIDDSLVEPLKLKLQRWLRGKNLNEHFGVVTEKGHVYIVRK